MAEASVASLALNRAQNLVFWAFRREHRQHSKTMVRRALAGVLATLLAQVTFGAAFEQIAEASSRYGWGKRGDVANVAPTSATAEALTRTAPVSVPPAITATPGDVPERVAPTIVPVSPES